MLIPILILVGLVCLFIVTFILNKKIKVPKGIETEEQDSMCASCSNATCLRKKQNCEDYKHEE